MIRDNVSNAVLSTDQAALIKYKNEKKQSNTIRKLENDLNFLRNEVNNIKELLGKYSNDDNYKSHIRQH